MKKESLINKIWHTLWPMLIYLVVQNIAALILMFFSVNMLVALLVSTLICIPVYYRMYRKDAAAAQEKKRNIPMTNRDVSAIIISSAALALGANNVISLTPLPYIFQQFEKTNDVLFGGGLVLQIFTAGIAACMTEELLMRGIIYKRMKRYWGGRWALVFSALVFGIYHMNVVQGVYAFFLGLFFAWLLERYDTLWAPVIAHMSANLFIIMISESGFVETVSGNLVPYCLVTCTSLLIFYYCRRWMKQTNPLVELEFVKKEPDTLKGLTSEYNEQERKED